MKRARILLADDHSMVAAGLSKLLDPEFDLVGVVEDGRALVAAAEREKPDVVLVDISMPLLNGLEAARELRAVAPETKIIFLTMHSSIPYVAQAFRCGAKGYVLKGSAASELPAAVREVLSGKTYVTPLIPKDALGSIMDGADKPAEKKAALSVRQCEVLQLVAEGHSAKSIANILNISTKTVEFHKGVIRKKLGLHSLAELTRYAMEHSISGS